ncbi:MAG: membrane-bound lytic murein transglycosylase MltF [Stagnimonas sp.]|nr:membrane-bound lytic murein transglycosylase MltF [Stagnimonas sp.]
MRVRYARPTLRSRLLVALYGCVSVAALSTCSQLRPSLLEQVRQDGVLKIAATYGRTTCYSGPDGLIGYECDLAQSFAKSLGVTAEVNFSHSPAEALQAVLDGRAHLAAAGLTINAERRDQARFSAPIDQVVPQLVYRMGAPRPKALDDLAGRLLVADGGSHVARLAALATSFPNLKWESTNAYDTDDLLFQVASGELDYTIANSALIAINQRYYPRLRVAFDVGSAEDVAFGFAPGEDSSLYDAAQGFLAQLSVKTLARLHDRYYGHVEEVDYFSAVQVATHLRSRLPRLRNDFENAAQRHQLDWRLLAAIGYQESHWDASARSFTGVRGIMMLTNDTALRYKVANREDPAQSIEGGARVLADILTRIPADVPEPDRSWMALAAYNQGIGHLLDARELAAKRGGDPNHWLDVRDVFPLLARPRWYQQTRYGYTRGREAVDFVGNVRAYYDIISWLTSGAPVLPPPPLRLEQKLHMAEVPLESPAPDLVEETLPQAPATSFGAAEEVEATVAPVAAPAAEPVKAPAEAAKTPAPPPAG